MKTFATFSLAAALALILGLTASAEDRKLIEKKEAREPTTDREFVVHALNCQIFEIKVGEFVAKNGANPDVRKFAQQMVDDHTKMRKDLLDCARDLKVGVVEGFDKAKQDEFDQLKKLKGSEFDREYMRMMIEGHEKALRSCEKWSTNAKEEKLRKVCKDAVPTIRAHLDHARKVRDSLKS